MIIKKIDEYIASRDMETIHVFEVNGKKIKVSHWTKDGEETDDCDSGVEILEQPKPILTDAEYEALGLDLDDHLKMEVGAEKAIEGDEEN